MNDAPPPPHKTRAIITSAFLVVMLFVGLYFAFTNGPSSVPGGVPFNPANFAELETKGTQPDGATAWSSIQVPPAGNADAGKGKEIFAKACAGCHGAEGKGDGPIPKKCDMPSLPADLTQPRDYIKIRSTYDLNGSVPLETDLFRTLTRGLPGTAMWSFRELPAEDRWALVKYITSLSPQYSSLPKQPLELPAKTPNDAESRKLGEAVFNLTCYRCHGMQGLGGDPPLLDPATNKEYPGLRFAHDGGTHMLTGNSEEDIARTLLCGLSYRSPMRSIKSYIYDTPNPTPKQKAEMDRKLWGIVYYACELFKK